MTDTEKTWTITDIKDASKASGSHWFDADTMRFHGTRVGDGVYQGPGGIFFVTSDKQYDGSRGATVRQFIPETCTIRRIGELAAYSLRCANLMAQEAAGEGFSTNY